MATSKKKLVAPATTHDLVAQLVAIKTRARKLYQKIDPLMAQITDRLTKDPDEPRLFEIDGQQYEFIDRFAGDRCKARVDQYVSRYDVQASR